MSTDDLLSPSAEDEFFQSLEEPGRTIEALDLYRAIELLTDRQKLVIARRYGINVQRHSLEQLADLLCITTGAVRRIEQRALAALGRIYGVDSDVA